MSSLLMSCRAQSRHLYKTKELSLRELFLYQSTFEFSSQGILSEVDALFLQQLLHADVVTLEDGGLRLLLYTFNIIYGFFRYHQVAWNHYGQRIQSHGMSYSSYSCSIFTKSGKITVAQKTRSAVFKIFLLCNFCNSFIICCM